MDGSSTSTSANRTAAEQRRAIVRQVEYYFSDENLPNDAHMLGLTGGAENKPVSVSRISGFHAMRQYKPFRSVIEALKSSTFLEFTDAKHVRRRVPFAGQANVEPEVIEVVARTRGAVQPGQSLKDPARPWVTKRMLKPNGFEEYFTDGPITPAEYSQDRELYAPENTFEARIEYAISRYCVRRKFHQDIRNVFDAFMIFGGIDTRPKQFTGGLSQEEMENMDAIAIAAATASKFVASHVEGSDQWTVDFPAVARGFLSSDKILNHSGDFSTGPQATNVIGNFYRYLLQHDVCPEYGNQVREALAVCQIAGPELQAAMQASSVLPDKFSRAMSVVSGGLFAGLSGTGDEFAPELEQAMIQLRAAFEQLGTSDQGSGGLSAASITITSERDVELQVTAIFLLAEAGESTLPRFGRMVCTELSKSFRPKRSAQQFVFWIEHEALSQCFVGMKMQITLCENSIGARWIERIWAINPSTYEVINNEFLEKEDAEIIPREWYKRQRSIKERGYDLQAGEYTYGPGDVDDIEDPGQDEVVEVADDEHDTTA